MRYQQLDALRGALAAIIVLVHAVAINGSQPWFLTNQWHVNTFMILSGFVAAMALNQRRRGYREFLLDRCARLFPVYWVCLTFSLLVRPLYLDTSATMQPLEMEEAHNFWPLLAIRIPLAQGMVPESILPGASMAFLPPAWFVSLILQISLVAPFLVKLGRIKLLLLFAFSLLILSNRIHWRFYEHWSSIGAFLPQKLYLFLAGILLFSYFPMLGRGPAPKALVWLGMISYSLYLVHYPILALIHAAVPQGGAWLTYLLGLPCSIVVAWALHEAIEKPSQEMIAKLLQKLLEWRLRFRCWSSDRITSLRLRKPKAAE
jgi:peptidoglycan/LPS O-acetylase OafA/YrhL